MHLPISVGGWAAVVMGGLAAAALAGAAHAEDGAAPAPIRVTFDELAPGAYTQDAAKQQWPGLKWFALPPRAEIVAGETWRRTSEYATC